jgi:hypothetical protein
METCRTSVFGIAGFFVGPSDNVAPRGAVALAESFIRVTDDRQPGKWLVDEKIF